MTVEKPKPKQLLRPITTWASLSQFVAIICNSLKEREKSRVHGAIGFGFNSHWLKNWRESFTGLLTGCAGVETHNNAQSEEIRKIPHNTEIFT